MKMPEATVYKYRHTMLCKNNVWGAGKHPVVETESESACMQCLSDSQFWFGVLGPDASHHGATLFRRNGITHAEGGTLGVGLYLRGSLLQVSWTLRAASGRAKEKSVTKTNAN